MTPELLLTQGTVPGTDEALRFVLLSLFVSLRMIAPPVPVAHQKRSFCLAHIMVSWSRVGLCPEA